MENINAVYFENRSQWRSWLEKNFDREKEVWLIFPHKSTGKPRIIYNDAVEEALCFGWIDSIIKKYDNDSSMQKFTPRNPKSQYSQQNKERLKWLSDNELLHPSVEEKIRPVLNEKFSFPEDIIKILKKEEIVWKNYSNFSDSYKRIRIAYIDTARIRPEEFDKRLQNFINKTRQNKLIGYGGIEKYF